MPCLSQHPPGRQGGDSGVELFKPVPPQGAFRVAKTSDKAGDQRSGSRVPRRGLARRLCGRGATGREKAQKVESPPWCSGGAAQRRVPRPACGPLGGLSTRRVCLWGWAGRSAPGLPWALVPRPRRGTSAAVGGWVRDGHPKGRDPQGLGAQPDSPARACAGHPRPCLMMLAKRQVHGQPTRLMKPQERPRNPARKPQERPKKPARKIQETCMFRARKPQETCQFSTRKLVCF